MNSFFSFLFGKNKVVDVHSNINELKDTMEILEKKCTMLEKKIQQEEQNAKQYIQQKNKNAAIVCLKRKQLYQSQIDSFQNQKNNVETMIFKLEEAIINKQTISSLQKTNTVFKELSSNMSVSHVENTMDTIQDTMHDFNEITNVLSSPISTEVIDEDELLSEFLEENMDVFHTPIIKKEEKKQQEQEEKENEEEELKKLEASMN